MAMRFSQRIGQTPIRSALQISEMDDGLRNKLWNAFLLFKALPKHIHWVQDVPEHKLFFQKLWNGFFRWPLDNLPDSVPHVIDAIRNWFFGATWFDVYDFIEFFALNAPDVNRADQASITDYCNRVLESEVSGYRFVRGALTPITDAREIAEIEAAVATGSDNRFKGVAIHLEAALAKFADRKQPDYRNSIKESISAVESACRIICGDQKAELGQALKLIEDRVGLHPALKKGFLAIYGYTSDEGGIRHALAEESRCDADDAKYMLVSCSAFINYLIGKLSKIEAAAPD